MEQLYEMITNHDVTLVGAVVKLVMSFVIGSAIGLERRRKGQVAGMRTFSLICMGATLAMLISIYIPQEYMGLKNGDPGRIAAQVISGIGFLGAGAIIQMKGSVKGHFDFMSLFGEMQRITDTSSITLSNEVNN